MKSYNDIVVLVSAKAGIYTAKIVRAIMLFFVGSFIIPTFKPFKWKYYNLKKQYQKFWVGFWSVMGVAFILTYIVLPIMHVWEWIISYL